MQCLFVFWHKSRRLYFLARLSSSWLVRLKHQRMRAMHCGSIKTNLVQKRLKALLRTNVLNDVTAAPFSGGFSQLPAVKKGTERCSCDVIKDVCRQQCLQNKFGSMLMCQQTFVTAQKQLQAILKHKSYGYPNKPVT